jgi:hypothetical protein
MDANEPIPYYAGLAKVLHGPTLALVLTYLEWYHPAPQDSPDGHPGIENAPVTIDCDQVSAALGVSRRTLHIALSCLGACRSSEEARVRAARVGREFLNTAHSLKPSGHDPVKCYSFTGPRSYSRPQILAMRRNHGKLASVLAKAGIIPEQFPIPSNVDSSTSSRSVRSLPLILKGVLPNWRDRRSDRWDRWRRENGKKSRNPGRMRGAKIVVSSTGVDGSDSLI